MCIKQIGGAAALLVALGGIFPLHPQDSEDSILVRARRRATTDNKPEEALGMLAAYLAEHPGDSDALVMKGLILSWESRYDEARQVLTSVLTKDPDYSDALLALCNVEMWSGNPEEAERLAREGLDRRPGYQPYMAAQHKALDKIKSARKTKDAPAAKGDQFPEWRELRAGSNWQVVTSQDSTFFGDGRSPFLEEQIGIKNVTPYGSYQLRAMQANQYGYRSRLVEIDAYPRIGPGTYAYFNVGFSPDHQLYPHYRFGGEVFQNLSHGFEASGGVRRLGFASKIQVYTASFSKYRGNWFYSVRTFVTPDSQEGTSRSVQFWVRRYFGDGVNYIGTRYGRGASPFEIESTLQTGVLASNTVHE